MAKNRAAEPNKIDKKNNRNLTNNVNGNDNGE